MNAKQYARHEKAAPVASLEEVYAAPDTALFGIYVDGAGLGCGSPNEIAGFIADDILGYPVEQLSFKRLA